jgi:tight adherence protein B
MGLSLLIFGTVTCGLIGGYYAITGALGRDAALVRRRMNSEFHQGGPDDRAAGPLFKKLDLDQPPAPLPDIEKAGEPNAAPGPGLHARLETMIEQSAVQITVQQLLTVIAAFGLSLGVAGTLFRGPLLGILGALTGTSLPLLYLNYRRKVRRERLLVQLPAAFDLMARVIRAGSSVPQALLAVTDSMEQPVAGEFAQCQKQQNLGLRPEVAFRHLARRTGILEMRIFAMAMLIQRQSGGNLSDVLERLGRLIRERLRLRGLVRALTAEGRLQGLTLMVLPVLMFGVMMVINRPYAEVLLEQKQLLFATLAAMGVGALWIRVIVNFEV